MIRVLPWLLLAATVGCCAWLANRLNERSAAAAELARVAERNAFEAAGAAALSDCTRAEAERRVGELSAELRAAVERAKRAVPGARVTGTITAGTGPVVAGGEARPGTPTCLLVPGDPTEVIVEQAELEGPAGARALVGILGAYRLSPGPRTRIAGGEFDVGLTDAVRVPQPAAPGPRWGVGGAVLVASHGFARALVLAAPPVSLFGLSLEASAVVGWGNAAAVVVVRP